MTDKEIIIEGVDVSGCEYYKENLLPPLVKMRTESCKGYGFCIHNLPNNFDSIVNTLPRCKGQNCSYKQLARLQAECSSQKGLITTGGKQLQDCLTEYEKLQTQYNEVVEQNKSLQKANRELKAKYLEVLEKSKKGLDAYEYCIQELEQENERLKGKE